MSNIIISPQSGIIEFNTGIAGSDSLMTSTAPIRLDATGGDIWFTGSNVGIGTTDPQFTLDVEGAIHGTSGNFSTAITVSGNPVMTGASPEADTLQTVTERGATSNQAISVSNVVTANEFNVGNEGKVKSTSTLGLQLLSSTNKDIIFAPNNGSTERMRIKADGDVGIGMTNPAAKLHIQSLDSNVLRLANDEAVYDDSQEIGIDFYGRWYSGQTSVLKSKASIVALGDTDGYQRGQLSFRVANDAVPSEAVRINRQGNVGIGTTSPDSRLHVVGSADSDTASLGSEIVASQTASGTNWSGNSIATGYTHTAGSTDVLLSTLNATTNKLYRVEIETTNVTAGRLDKISFGGIETAVYITNNQTRVLSVKAISTGPLTFECQSAFVGTVTVSSVKEIVASDSLSVLTNSGGSGRLETRVFSTTDFFLGDSAGENRVSSGNNIGIGNFALQRIATAGINLAIGNRSLSNLINGSYNVAIGHDILGNYQKSGNVYNIGLGNNVMDGSSMTGQSNIMMGFWAGANMTSASHSLGIGYSVFANLTSGSHNIALGEYSLNNATSGGSNIALGNNALQSLTTTSSNIAIGRLAGRYAIGNAANETPSQSIYIGYNTKAAANGETNQIVIGYNAEGIGANTVTLGNDSVVTTALKGNVGIGITDPDQKLDVDGNIRIPNQGKIVFGSAGTATDYLQLWDVVAGYPLLKLVQDNVERFSIEGVSGNVSVSGGLAIKGASLSSYHQFQSDPVSSSDGNNLFTVGGQGMQGGYSRAVSMFSSTVGVWNSWVGTNLRFDGTNFKRASDNGGQNWGNIAGIRFLGNSSTTGASIVFLVDPPTQSGAPSGEQTVASLSGMEALEIHNDKKIVMSGTLSVDSGDITLGGTGRIQGIDTVSSGTDATSKTYVDNAITSGVGSYLPLAGGTMTGDLNLTYAYPRINLTDTNHNSDYSIINNDGIFSIYDITNNSHRLSISAAGNATFASDVTLTDGILTVNDGNNYVKISEGSNSIGQIELKDGDPVFLQGWGSAFKIAIGTYNNHALSIATNKTATFSGNITIDNGTSSTLLIEKDATGGGKIQFNDAGSQKAYFALDAYEHIVYYGAANVGQYFYAGGVLNETKTGTLSTFAGNVTVSGGDITLGGTGRIQGIDTVSASTDAANKAYVDAQVGSADTLQEVTDNGATTTNPISALAITGTAGLNQFKGSTADSSSNTIVARNSSNTSLFSIRNDGRVDIPVGPVNIGNNLYLDNNEIWAQNSANLNVKAAGDVKIQTNNGATTAATFKSDGKVGIGTTSPSQKLEVDGNILVTTSSSTQPFKTFEATYKSFSVDYPSSPSSFTTQLNFGHFGRLQYDGNGGVLSLENRSTQSGTSSMRFVMGTTERMHISDTGNVGIGTASPSERLVVQATNDSNLAYEVGSGGYTGNSGGVLNLTGYYDYTGSRLGLYVDNAGKGNIATKTGQPLVLSTNNTEKLRITSSGNVGIGTTSPSEKLDVVGDVKIKGSADFYNTSNQLYGRVLSDSEGLTFDTVANRHTRFYKQGVETMRIDTSGNVGIGTAIPYAYDTTTTKLHVRNAGSSGSISEVARLEGASDADGSGAILRIGTSNDRGIYLEGGRTGSVPYASIGTTEYNGAKTEGIRITSTGNVGIGTTNPTSQLQVDTPATSSIGNGIRINRPAAGTHYHALEFSTDGTCDWSIGQNVADALEIFENGADATTRLTILEGGNVGIGAISPATKLEVDGNIRLTDYTDDIQFGGTANMLSYNQWQASASGGMIIKNIASASTGHIAFQTSLGEKVRILRDGNVGIGTTSPSDQDLSINAPKLHVVGPSTTGAFNLVARFQGGNDNNNTGAAILINHSNDRGLLINAGRADSDREVAYFNLVSSGANITNMLTLRKVGNAYNVGVGTTSPTTKLHIDDDASTGTGLLVTGGGIGAPLAKFTRDVGGSGSIEINSNGSDPQIQFASYANTFALGTNASTFEICDNNVVGANTRLSIDSSGNVGIGTTSPSVPLEVAGIIKTSTSLVANAAIVNQVTAATANGNINIKNNNGVDLARFTHAGDFGINTTSPSYQLEVNGGILAGGKVTYHKSAGSLTTTGYAVAGLTSFPLGNGASAGFTFTCFGHLGDYQKIVYSCYNVSGTWNTQKVIDEGTNDFDVTASANGSTITFTFKSRSGTKSYTPRVSVEAFGSSINNTYA